MIKTSIVIATADRVSIVADCLAGLKSQLPTAVEIIIVDGGQSEPVDPVKVVGLWANSRVIRSAIQNAGVQRNEGVRQAAGDVIVFLDDDTHIQPGWWPAIVAPLIGSESPEMRCKSPASCILHPASGISPSNSATLQLNNYLMPKGVGATAGAVWCNPKPTFTDKRGGYINWRGEPVQVTHRSANAPRDVDWPMTTNMAVRKDAFWETGGFSEVYGIYDEDVDFGMKLRRAGWGIRFVPEAAVYHYFLKRPRRIPTKQFQFMLGRNRSLLLVRHYGISSRLLLFLVTEPWIHFGRAAWVICKTSGQAIIHLIAYCMGSMNGIYLGWRNPVVREMMNHKADSRPCDEGSDGRHQ